MTMPQVLNRSATKPIYIVLVDDPTEKDNLLYIKTQDLIETNACLEVQKGYVLTKTEAGKLRKDPHAKISAKKAVNRRYPWHKVHNVENITYNKPQGENND